MDDNTKQIVDMISEIKERTARIEAQTERIFEIDRKTNEAKTESTRAKETANNNRQNIKVMWGFISGLLIAVITGFIRLLMEG